MSLYPRDSIDLIFSQQGDALVDLTKEKPWSIPNKVAISAAVCGSFFRLDNNPHQPYTAEEIRAEAEASIEAGIPLGRTVF